MIALISQRLMKYTLTGVLKVEHRLGVRSARDIYYFGYGANMGASRIKSLGSGVEKVGSATLKDFKLVFSVPCEYKGKGFASVEPSEDSEVWGVLYKLSARALLLLDIFEWLPFGFYDRVRMSVVCDGAEVRDVWVYLAKTPDGTLVPSKDYLNYIVTSARENGLSAEYILGLEKHRARETFELDPGFRLSNPAKRRVAEKAFGKIYLWHDRVREKVAGVLR